MFEIDYYFLKLIKFYELINVLNVLQVFWFNGDDLQNSRAKGKRPSEDIIKLK